MSVRIVVGGVANCGKSTLTASIYREFQLRGIDVSIHELDVFENTIPYIIGIESFEQRIKVNSGDRFNPRITQAINAFERDNSQFIFGDLTGIIDGLLEEMVKNADLAVAMGKDQNTLQRWLEFFASQSIPVVLRVISYIGNIPLGVPLKDIIFIGNLNRKVLQNDEIRLAADILLSHCGKAG